jgi:hypothetical protein
MAMIDNLGKIYYYNFNKNLVVDDKKKPKNIQRLKKYSIKNQN